MGKDGVDGERGLRDKITKEKMTDLRFRSRSKYVLDTKEWLHIPGQFQGIF
ncbi:hypothetical protein H206_03523 [Candidatus Electrothrix aarhusensis]|uniref:Uncharacterized protein n=1 Tax=Candidatus Electrothrix aarhusensis TaxID=1859131 RepID=A0A444IV33_9BACT|nr:hypothetical protein H206_03523 [Candidatus Electrothrix aarhusensis]